MLDLHSPEPLPELRRGAPVVEALDPMALVPEPNVMGELYADEAIRTSYPDGMQLASALPVRPYEEIVEDYTQQREGPDFDPLTFWDANFVTPDIDRSQYVAPEGMSLDDYTRAMQRLLTKPGVPDSDDPLQLPYDHPIPGERFTHFYGWDSYHVALGYEANGNWQGVLDIADSMRHLIERFGYVPNFNGAGITRPQPPYFPRMVRMIAEQYGPEALAHYLEPLEREYNHWMAGKDVLEERAQRDPGKVHGHRSLIRMADGSYLSRYWDDAKGPRLESYKEDLELAARATHGLEGAEKAQKEEEVFQSLRSGAGWAWDYSTRQFRDGRNFETICAAEILPVDLNSLMASTEETLAIAHMAAGNPEKAMEYWKLYEQRIQAINTHHWDPVTKVYRDKNFVEDRQTDVLSAAMAYPLYAGISDREQTAGVLTWLQNNDFLTPGGISTTDRESDQRWDGRKNIWLPTNWAMARGMARQGHVFENGLGSDLLDYAEEVQQSYVLAKVKEFLRRKQILEKHDGDDIEATDEVYNGGEYKNQTLGMSIFGLEALRHTDLRDPQDCYVDWGGKMLQLVGVNKF